MVRYVKTIDELVDLIDREYSGKNAVCPICKSKIGTVNIPDIELGLPEMHFMQYKHPGIFCVNGHCVISMEQEDEAKKRSKVNPGNCKLRMEDIGIKVFEVMKLIKPYLSIDDSVPNMQIYWMLMNRESSIYTREMPLNDAYDLMDRLQKLGARAEIV